MKDIVLLFLALAIFVVVGVVGHYVLGYLLDRPIEKDERKKGP